MSVFTAAAAAVTGLEPPGIIGSQLLYYYPTVRTIKKNEMKRKIKTSTRLGTYFPDVYFDSNRS